ncbi:bi1-like protein [Sesbania bispinosa]|nr:bi1-like protein [Sesbania bispinosa]
MLLKLFSRFRERFAAWVLDDGREDEERERPQQTGTKREEKGDNAGYTSVKRDEFDFESGETLYPGLSLGENQLRWGFTVRSMASSSHRSSSPPLFPSSPFSTLQ